MTLNPQSPYLLLKGAMENDCTKIETFAGDGSIDFVTWMEHVELLFGADGLSDKKRQVVLPALLSGRALQVYKDLSNEIRQDNAELKQALTTAFWNPETKVRAREQMHVCQLMDHSCVSDFAAEVQNLADQAYGNLQKEVKDEIMHDSFIRGLSPYFHRAIKPLSLKTFNEVVSICERLAEDRDFSSRPDQKSKAGNLPIDESNVDQIVESIRQLALSRERAMGRVSQDVSTSSVRSGPICFYCGFIGHKQFECHQKMADEAQWHGEGLPEDMDTFNPEMHHEYYP